MSLKQYEEGEERGPVWKDVAAMAGELEREYKGKVIVALGLAPFGVGRLSMDLKLMRLRGRTDWYTVAVVAASWPTTSFRTMPALLVKRLYDLEDAIVAADERAADPFNAPEARLPLPPAS